MSKTENNHKPFKDIEFKSLIIAFKGMLIIFFIVISLILIFSIKSVAISQDIDYSFENDIFISNPSFDGSHYNVKNQSLYTEHYNATYSFTNLDENTSNYDIPFLTNIYSSDSEYLANIINNIDTHSKNIQFSCIGDNEASTSFYNEFSTISTNFIIELLFYYIDNGIGNYQIYGFYNLNTIFNIRINSSSNILRYFHGNDFTDINNIFSNQWYHLQVSMNIISDTYNLSLNGNLEGNNLDSYNFIDIVGINKLIFGLDGFKGLNEGLIYFDAIGYSWDDNYTIGQNLIPYLEINPSIKEVDKFTFDYEGFLDNYDVGDDNPSTWSDIESGGDDDSNIALHQTDYTKRRIYMEQYAPDSDDTGIEKEFDIELGIIDIYWSVNFTDISGTNEFCTKVYSYDDTLISDIYFEGINLLYNYDGSNTLYSSITTNKSYELNLYINYYDNISILEFYIDNVYENTYFIPLLASEKNGLGKIEIYIDVSVGYDMECYLDDVGVYVNGSSLSTELGYLSTDWLTLGNFWSFTEYNLFDFYVIGNSSFHVLRYPYIPDISTVSRINDLDYYNTSQFLNLYNFTHETNPHCQYPSLWIEFYNQIQIFQVNIEGVKLVAGSNEYPLIFSYADIDIQDNYFYVKSNRLYYNHNANENDTLEYIQAYFNIDNEHCLNSSINFKAYFLGISKAYFKLNYVSETNSTFTIPIGYKSYNIILPQQQIIKSFTFLITDNNDNDNYGNSEGYFSSIKLNYYVDIELTILTLSLIEILIPLIVLIIPTLAIASVYGKKAIIPMLILMTIICLIGNLIEPELFFIIMLCLGSAIFLQYKIERGK